MVAQLTVNQLVAGSNPATRAKQRKTAPRSRRDFCLPDCSIRRDQQHGDGHTEQNDTKAAAATGVFLIADELLGILLATPSGMAFGTIELPKAIAPRLDRPRVMPERPSASATPIRLVRRSPERPLQPPNQQEDNHHDRPHRQIDQSVIAVVHRPSNCTSINMLSMISKISTLLIRKLVAQVKIERKIVERNRRGGKLRGKQQ